MDRTTLTPQFRPCVHVYLAIQRLTPTGSLEELPRNTTTPSGSMTATNVRKATAGIRAGFLLVGILGFVPGITTPYGDLQLAGHGSSATSLGLLKVSDLHNVVHLLLGVAGLAMARGWARPGSTS